MLKQIYQCDFCGVERTGGEEMAKEIIALIFTGTKLIVCPTLADPGARHICSNCLRSIGEMAPSFERK